jgi:hypothetical protein
MLDQDPAQPYPGLRPFESSEADLFFGRERQVDALLERLSHSHFVAVVGESGAGKSSLVRAGLLPALDAGFVVEAGSDWRVAVMRPGGTPLAALADALLATHVLTDAGGTPRREFALAELRRGPFGLAQLVSDAHLPATCNLLLVVDQFEELFRYCREPAQKDQASIFVELLLEAATQRHVSISVVLTMRSDFVGDCARFRGLPERLNDNQFLTPRLTREQVAVAIRGPARVCGGVVDASLVDELCNAVGDDQDQLPLLQHLLMRMWEEACKVSNPPRLTSALSKVLGGLHSALSNHAQQIFDLLPDETARAVAQSMFRGLTDPFSQRWDLRRDASVSEVAAIASVASNEVIAVANEFRGAGRHMLMPPAVIPLDANSRLDISHESLIRQWSSLSNWAAEEATNAREFARLHDEAMRDRKDRELLTGRNLDRALDWKRQARPTVGWAARYAPVGALEATLAFIDESEKRETEKTDLEKRMLQREAAAKRRGIYYRVFAIMMLLVLAAASWAAWSQYQLRQHDQEDRKKEDAEKEKDKKRENEVQADRDRTNTQNLTAQKALRDIADKRAASATAGEFAADSLLLLADDPAQAMSKAVDALNTSIEGPDQRAVQALRNAIAANVPNLELPFAVAKHKNFVPGTNKGTYLWTSLTASSVSSLLGIVVVPSQGMTTIFSTITGDVVRTVTGDAIISSAIVGPDGKLMVTTGSEHMARVWNASTGAPAGGPLRHAELTSNEAINGAAFSRDGKTLVTLGDGNFAKVWNVANDYEQFCPDLEKPGNFEFANFSKDQPFLVTITHSGGLRQSSGLTATVWRVESGNCREERDPILTGLLTGLQNSVASATFSPAGPDLAVVTETGKVKLVSWTPSGWKPKDDFDSGPDIRLLHPPTMNLCRQPSRGAVMENTLRARDPTTEYGLELLACPLGTSH